MKEQNVQLDDLLYHYTSIDTAIKHILNTNKLRLSPLKMVNDPKESKFPVIPWTLTKDLIAIRNKDTIIRRIFEEHTKIICFSQDRYIEDEIVKGYDLPTMWAHYGDKHQGVCLVFKKRIIYDKLCASFTEKNLIHNNVNYKNSLDEDIKNIRFFTQDDFKFNTSEQIYQEYSECFFKKMVPFFLTKRLDWLSEQENRFIVCENNTGYTYFNFGNALDQIILGMNISHQIKEYCDLKQYALNNNIKISQMNWEFGRGMLVGLA